MTHMPAGTIIYITESSGYGGAEKYLLDVSAAGGGRFQNVFTALPFAPANEEVRRRLAAKGITVTRLKQYRANYPLNLYHAVKFLSSHTAAVLHFSLPHTDSCRWLLLAAALLKRTYFITEHSVPPDPYRENMYFFVTHLLFNPLKKFSYKRARKVIAVSEGNRSILVSKYNMPPEKLTVIHNGVDCDVCKPDDARERLREKFRIPGGSVVLICVGRMDGFKGYADLIAAFEKLFPDFPSSLLLLVGDGPLRESFEADVLRRGLFGSVRFTGYREDVPDLLCASDIFVLASLKEGFPYTILEAMAAGRPVVATDVGGNKEAVLDGVTGIIVEPKNVEQLSAAVSSLVSDEAVRKEMGAKGVQRVKTLFSKEKMCEETLSLYGDPGK